MNVDDDGIKMFGMILIVAIVLILLSTCYFQNGEENGTFECPEGQVYLSEFNCCSLDGVTCFEPPPGCIIVPCEDPKICCVPDVCEVQPDGSQKCMPCSTNSPCDPDEEYSCCADMFCDVSGYCENCEDYPCNSIEDCCDNYECNDLLCESCERICGIDDDCCDGWMCTVGECENCDRPCDPSNPCCAGDACNFDTLKCEGCIEGAYCSLDKPCCPGYKCDLDTNECQETNTLCENMPCLEPGKLCNEQIIFDGIEEMVCEDVTICSNSLINSMFICKNIGNCPEGQYDCSDEYLNCICCDAETGECVTEEKIVECSDITNCEVCSCISYDVLVCPNNYQYCPGKGCFNPQGVSYSLNDVCRTCTSINDPNACCTLLVPEDAQSDAGVIFVSFTECLSGYKFKDGTCVSRVNYHYDDEAGHYSYSFISSITQISNNGISKAGPNELIITNARISDDNCITLPNEVFSLPQLFNVG